MRPQRRTRSLTCLHLFRPSKHRVNNRPSSGAVSRATPHSGHVFSVPRRGARSRRGPFSVGGRRSRPSQLRRWGRRARRVLPPLRSLSAADSPLGAGSGGSPRCTRTLFPAVGVCLAGAWPLSALLACLLLAGPPLLPPAPFPCPASPTTVYGFHEEAFSQWRLFSPPLASGTFSTTSLFPAFLFIRLPLPFP